MINLSVIIPTCNRLAALRECLADLADSEYPVDQFEVIVVDDGSREAVEPHLADFHARLNLVVIRQENSGAAAARNSAARLARGGFLAFTDDDCRPERRWLHVLALSLAANPASLLGGQTTNANPASIYARVSHGLSQKDYATYESDPVSVRFFGSNNLALTRELLIRTGGFDERMRPAYEDREFCDRLRVDGVPMIYVAEARVAHNRRPTLGSFISQHMGYGRGACAYYGKGAGIGRTARSRNFFSLMGQSIGTDRGLTGWCEIALILAAQGLTLVGFGRAALERWMSREDTATSRR